MTEHDTDTLYRKEGRRYKPAFSIRRWDFDGDAMKPGTFRLTHAYESGGRRYEYDVTPDTAAVVAALSQFRLAVEAEINSMASARPGPQTVPYTKKQQAVLERFRAEMEAVGGMLPTWWQHSSAHEISEAAAKVLRKHLEAS